uniref:Ras and Rab interactor 2b n=1 Tax=Electrophorus electricus TaxID=8005 RepID=A0A4W4EJB0_ELEEL
MLCFCPTLIHCLFFACSVEGEVSGVYLQYPLVGGPCESENVSKRISAQERVTLTHPIWLLLSVTEQEATRILLQQPVGVFLVRRSSALQKKVLSLRVDNTPGSPIIHYPLEESLFNVVLERAMHKCVLKPLHGSVYAALHKFQVSSGVWQRLQENLAIAKSKQPGELGADTVRSPDLHAIKRIRLKLRSMCKMYSPERKIKVLLHVCKLIYTDMQNRSGRSFGADDFLPMLTYVLAQCDMPQLDTEVQYMMELLDPSLLHGEGGYYLTSACGAMSLIKNFQEDQAACVLSSATRSTLHQWHQRRTIQRNLPSVDDFQNFLRVALQEADSGCTAKTLQVHPNNTTEEVSRLCAHKFHVTDPENYALFLITDDCSQQLAPDTYPQWIKAEFQSRPHPKAFYFVYRRLPNPNGCKPSQSHNSSCTED